MKKMVLLFPFLLVGCAKVGDYQARCEQQYPEFGDMVNCLDNSIQTDSRLSSASTPKLYVLTAKMLSKSVSNGKISEDQARVALQNLYVNMQQQENQQMQQDLLTLQSLQTMQSIDKAAQQPTYVPQLNRSITTNCTRFGNTVNCNSQ